MQALAQPAPQPAAQPAVESAVQLAVPPGSCAVSVQCVEEFCEELMNLQT